MPFSRFPGTDTRLGPEMKSTGEVMGIADDLPGRVRQGGGRRRRAAARSGNVFLSVCDSDKSAATILAQRLHTLGFKIYATRGTATALHEPRHPGAGS